MSAEGNLWYVKTADGDVLRLTVDEIDEAFNAGQIDANTMCLPDGETTWSRLGVLAGLEAPAPAPVVAPAPAPRAAPVAYAAPAAYSARPVPIASAPAAAPYAPIPNSLRPVSMDLGDDLDVSFKPRRSRKGLVVGFVASAALLGAGAFLAVRAGALRNILPASASHETVAAAAAPAPPPPTPAPTTPPAQDLYTPPPAPAVPSAEPGTSRFSEDQKAKLLAADKTREEQAKSRKKARAAGGHGGGHHGSTKFSFTSGGNKYDPLNAN